jgi:hypothetical protein
MIAITVAAAVLLYVFAIGLLGSYGSTGGQQISAELILEAYSWSPGTITGAFKNVGPTAISLAAADMFIGGLFAGHPGGACAGLTLAPQQGCSFMITPSGPYVNGESYSMKLVTANGSIFTYPIIYGATI